MKTFVFSFLSAFFLTTVFHLDWWQGLIINILVVVMFDSMTKEKTS